MNTTRPLGLRALKSYAAPSAIGRRRMGSALLDIKIASIRTIPVTLQRKPHGLIIYVNPPTYALLALRHLSLTIVRRVPTVFNWTMRVAAQATASGSVRTRSDGSPRPNGADRRASRVDGIEDAVDSLAATCTEN